MQKKLLLGLFFGTIIGLSNPIETNAAPPALYISGEVGHNLAANRVLADTLDNTWRYDNSVLGACASCIENGSIPVGATNISTLMTTSNGITVSVSLRDMTNVSDQTDFGVPANTQGYAGSNTATSMQDDSPKPQSHVTETYYNETSGSGASRNGVLISFSQPVRSFGAFFGDLETRNDGQGTPAELRLYDASNTLLSSSVIVSDTPDQSLCGSPVNANFRGCGNDMTRWIGFITDEIDLVSSMLVIVGDDDSWPGSDNGNTEHMSFNGFAVVGDYPDTPEISSAKRLVSSTNNGDDTFEVSYEISVQNDSTILLDDITLIDDLHAAFVGAGALSVSNISANIIAGPTQTMSQLALNPSFGSGSDWSIVDPLNSALESGDSFIIGLSATVDPGTFAGPYLNSATITGYSSYDVAISDQSEDDQSLNPDPDGNNDPYETDNNTPTPVTFVLGATDEESPADDEASSGDTAATGDGDTTEPPAETLADTGIDSLSLTTGGILMIGLSVALQQATRRSSHIKIIEITNKQFVKTITRRL